jgi:DNA-binding MarR family transcriptional regulator
MTTGQAGRAPGWPGQANPPAGPQPPDALSTRAETIRLVLELWHRMHADLCAVACEHDLTPVQVRALLDMTAPAPMRALAERLSCDKSHVTGVVDGLEKRGLVARRSDPRDRRVKQLVLTARGQAFREELRTRLYLRAPALSNLTGDEEERLRWLLRAALGPADGPVAEPVADCGSADGPVADRKPAA